MSKAPESLLYPGLCSLCRGPVKRAKLINLLFMSLITYICTVTSSGGILVWVAGFEISIIGGIVLHIAY